MGLFDEVRAVQKPNFKRRTKKRGDRGRISPAVYDEVMKRDNGRCVLCGKTTWLQAHHILFKSEGGTGEAHNIALACGPVGQKGTCHWKAHHTKEGRQAFRDYREYVLLPYYTNGAS
ncbi:HNH endonuclease [Brevibacillus laterosporus]|uniref:HNH endonuclease n=1 Tax=Brevibacillus laterosporus TaxID=1465 RepID=UPI000CE44C33|nr:HNH endonuclease [Brevibacillus laterosporus]PPA85920.1 HNH endonuclease [Brevibacillus laterosporus]